MAWIAVDKNGTEVIFSKEPFRLEYYNYWMLSWGKYRIELPRGTIEKILGKIITWNDDPVEIK
jgi:lysophospholipid acyltransferase (LPLAT)-like uncharacterized protein